MDPTLKGKRVLITGGTKSIGRAIVDAFLAEGAVVGFCARDAKLVKERETDWRSQHEAGWRKAIDIDIVSTVNAAHHARPHLEKTGLGATLTIIGTVSFVEVSGPTSPYRSVKAALVPFAKSLAIDMGPKGVRANVVSPGTRAAAWARRRRSRRAWCSWPASTPRSSAARTSSSTAP